MKPTLNSMLTLRASFITFIRCLGENLRGAEDFLSSDNFFLGIAVSDQNKNDIIIKFNGTRSFKYDLCKALGNKLKFNIDPLKGQGTKFLVKETTLKELERRFWAYSSVNRSYTDRLLKESPYMFVFEPQSTEIPEAIQSPNQTTSATSTGTSANAIVTETTTMPSVEEEQVLSTHYDVLISNATRDKIESYKTALANGNETAGCYLALKLPTKENIEKLSIEKFLDCLIQTKKPQIFAENVNLDPKFNWNSTEASILGDILFSVPVTVFDNGRHRASHNDVHDTPFNGTLLFVPGALLVDDNSPDYQEIMEDYEFNQENYYQLYVRRLLPALMHANQKAQSTRKKAFITIPGVGCGQFAGDTPGIKEEFQNVLHRMLETYGERLSHIAAVYLDLYDEGFPSTKVLHEIDFIVRPLRENGLPQLCHPQEYGEKYSQCEFFSVVAWDHFSWPGNDFWIGNRSTDDGVKAAATDTMRQLTGVSGTYGERYNEYMPTGYNTWIQLVEEEGINLLVTALQVFDVSLSQGNSLEEKPKRRSSVEGFELFKHKEEKEEKEVEGAVAITSGLEFKQ